MHKISNIGIRYDSNYRSIVVDKPDLVINKTTNIITASYLNKLSKMQDIFLLKNSVYFECKTKEGKIKDYVFRGNGSNTFLYIKNNKLIYIYCGSKIELSEVVVAPTSISRDIDKLQKELVSEVKEALLVHNSIEPVDFRFSVFAYIISLYVRAEITDIQLYSFTKKFPELLTKYSKIPSKYKYLYRGLTLSRIAYNKILRGNNVKLRKRKLTSWTWIPSSAEGFGMGESESNYGRKLSISKKDGVVVRIQSNYANVFLNVHQILKDSGISNAEFEVLLFGAGLEEVLPFNVVKLLTNSKDRNYRVIRVKREK